MPDGPGAGSRPGARHNGRVPVRPVRRHRPARSLRAGVTAVAVAALLGACADASDPAARGTDPAPGPATTDAAAAQAAPAGPDLPEQRVAAGPVDAGAPATVTGTGPAVVTFTRAGESGTVGRLDCTACTGPFELTAADRADTPWASGTAPLAGDFLVDPLADDATDRELVVTAQGSWSLTLLSWSDLPAATGPQQGSGPAVLRYADPADALVVSWTQHPGGTELYMRAVPEPTGAGLPRNEVSGADSSTQLRTRTAMPGVLGIVGDGDWVVTPAG